MKLKKLSITLFAAMAAQLCAGTRIVVLSDVHVTPGNANESKLIEAVEEINSLKGIDLVIMNGDLTNEGSDEQLKNVKRILDKITYPLYTLPGNHENNWSQSATRTFIDLWGNDRFVTEVDDLIIIGCNCGPYMKMGDGHIKQEDLHWLKSTLDKMVSNNKRVVSFNHYPIRKDDIDNYIDYIRVLENYPTIVHINGHYHRYIPYKSGNIPSMMVASLDQGDNIYGYSILDIDKDSVSVYRKVIGKDEELLERFHTTTTVEPYITEDTVSHTVPEGVTITKLWTDSASIFTRIGINSQNIFFGNSLGDIKAIDKNNGELKWGLNTGASLFSRPVSTDSVVVVPTILHKIMMLDARNGSVISESTVEGPYVADGVIENGTLYQGGYKMIEKREIGSGKTIWRFDSISNYCQASPVIDGDDIVFGAWDTNLRCLNKNTGELKWKWNNGKEANMLGPGNVVPVVTSDKIIIVAPDRYMTAINRQTGTTLWRNNDHRYRESLGVSADGTTAYAKTMDGELVAVDITGDDFNEKWIVDMGIGYDHAPCIVGESNGIIYAGSRRGILSAVDPSEKKLLWTASLGNSEINGIDIDPSDGTVYVSLIEGTIFKITKTE